MVGGHNVPVGNTDLTDIDVNHAESYPGMAHFAGTGPKGKTCGGCKFFVPAANRSPQFVCDKYRTLMRGRTGKPIEHKYKACKYYENKVSTP